MNLALQNQNFNTTNQTPLYKPQFKHPFPGNSLRKTDLPIELRGALYELGVWTMSKGYLIDPTNNQLNSLWGTKERKTQRILAQLELRGFIKRYITKFHHEGKVKTKRKILLIPLDIKPLEASKISDTSNESHNIINSLKKENLFKHKPERLGRVPLSEKTIIEPPANVDKKINLQGLYEISKTGSSELKKPDLEIKQKMKAMLKDAILPEKETTNFRSWTLILLCLGFDKPGIGFFGKRMYFTFKHKESVFYSMLSLLSSCIDSVDVPGAWLMAEMKGYCEITTKTDKIRSMKLLQTRKSTQKPKPTVDKEIKKTDSDNKTLLELERRLERINTKSKNREVELRAQREQNKIQAEKNIVTCNENREKLGRFAGMIANKLRAGETDFSEAKQFIGTIKKQ